MPQRSFNWNNIEGIIFDVDGTLYDQKGLRLKMLGKLLKFYIIRPHRFSDLIVIREFRMNRERLAIQGAGDFIDRQYRDVADKLNISKDEIYNIIHLWLVKIPTQVLHKYRFDDLYEFLNALKTIKIKTAIFSDYSASAKLEALRLVFPIIISSEDPAINRLKPNSKGLRAAINKMGIPKEACLFIGDRDDRDGACARNAGINYLIKGSKDPKFGFGNYKDLQLEMETALLMTTNSNINV